ncbi:MAG TPA: GH1 family beta-glucosidase [Nitriliruptoraceae bacterium]|nr:GH1 family beta-glucosidase [Nitriliruptoraceae bacterium]
MTAAQPTPQPAGVDEESSRLLARRVPSLDRTFPRDFVWGVATSSYQIEGAVDEDGRGASIWDTFSAVPGATVNGDTGAVAVDHYHRWAEDLDLMAWLGVDAYRFSIAWPRIVPDASGQVNQAGLDFYRRLVDGMLERGIEPSATLYHWDLPQWLQDRGGWAARSTVDAFVDYAATVTEALGTVTMWATHNEPWCAAFLGHGDGEHAPGIRDDDTAVAACHHLLLSHGRAIEVMRDVAGHERDEPAQLGIVLNIATVTTTGTTAADHEAVRFVDGGRNRAWLDPLFRGAYPDDVLADWAPVADLSVIRDGDLDMISQPLDWLGINFYHPLWVAAGEGSAPEPGTMGVAAAPPPGPRTAMDWPIEASGLADIVHRVVDDYGSMPIFITENGGAFPDNTVVAGLDGAAAAPVIDDQDRIAYLSDHLQVAHDLVAAGIDLRGYFAWSLLDNFEWAWGYGMRFGIVHVDYDTLVRTPKASAHFFRRVIADSNSGD